jgi:hypothetical protein
MTEIRPGSLAAQNLSEQRRQRESRPDALLRQSIRELSEGPQQVTSAASLASQLLAQESSHQAATIEGTSASSEASPCV